MYARPKHPFLSPPAETTYGDALNELIQDTLRGEALKSLPFFNKHKVVDLLNRLPHMSAQLKMAYDPVLMVILSSCLMQERFNMGSNLETVTNSENEDTAYMHLNT